ncbi:hypothetical protein LJC09_04235 [Desulfovibrio sp. OttesenSCG-928-F20]|nr:hypothetical protein [Desulfovibrio sp. OttesenSCG-928-F20]
MAEANLDIINRALDFIGQQPLVSLDESGPVAARVQRMWPQARDAVLREHNWKCAIRRTGLNRLKDPPLFGFSARFQLPPDFLRLVATNPEGARVEVEGASLLADCGKLSVAYVARLDDPRLYDAALAEALSLKLAAELAFGSSASTSLAQQMEVRYQQKLRDARSYDSREGAGERWQLGSWARARLGF